MSQANNPFETDSSPSAPNPTTGFGGGPSVNSLLQPSPNKKTEVDAVQLGQTTNPIDVPPASKPVWKRILGFLLSWIVIPFLIVLFVHNFVFQAWYVEGESMQPTFQNGDYLIVSKFEASWHKLTGTAGKLDIKRGDVIIFNPPGLGNNIYFIKRAIGLPGDRIVIKNGKIEIFNKQHPDGQFLNETYTANIPLEGDIDTPILPGEIFAVGDNRNPQASHDSRAIGPIAMERIVGIAALRLLPVSQFGAVAHPTYNEAQNTNLNAAPPKSSSTFAN